MVFFFRWLCFRYSFVVGSTMYSAFLFALQSVIQSYRLRYWGKLIYSHFLSVIGWNQQTENSLVWKVEQRWNFFCPLISGSLSSYMKCVATYYMHIFRPSCSLRACTCSLAWIEKMFLYFDEIQGSAIALVESHLSQILDMSDHSEGS